MKTIGMIGGMSWESSALYYKALNEGIKTKLGGLHSAKTILFSVDFHDIEQLQHKADWDGAAAILIDAAQSLEKAGADFILICTNTMHKLAPQIEQSISIPVLHIADATATQITQAKLNKVGLLGTRFTMEQAFYKGRLTDTHNIDVITPNDEDMDIIHRIIYEELCLGIINDASRTEYLRIIETLRQQSAQAVILGCTEITLLVQPHHTSMLLFDTTAIHAQAAITCAL